MSKQLFVFITIVYILQLHNHSISIWSQNPIFSGRVKNRKMKNINLPHIFTIIGNYPEWSLFSERVTYIHTTSQPIVITSTHHRSLCMLPHLDLAYSTVNTAVVTACAYPLHAVIAVFMVLHVRCCCHTFCSNSATCKFTLSLQWKTHYWATGNEHASISWIPGYEHASHGL